MRSWRVVVRVLVVVGRMPEEGVHRVNNNRHITDSGKDIWFGSNQFGVLNCIRSSCALRDRFVASVIGVSLGEGTC